MKKLNLATAVMLLLSAFSLSADDYQNPLDAPPSKKGQCVYQPFGELSSYSGEGYALNYRVRCNDFVGQLQNNTHAILRCEFKGQTTGHSGSITALPNQTTETAVISAIAPLGQDFTVACAAQQSKVKTLQSRPDGCCELQQRSFEGQYQLRVKSLKPMIFGAADSLCTIKNPSEDHTLISERVSPESWTKWVTTTSAAKLAWGCSR